MKQGVIELNLKCRDWLSQFLWKVWSHLKCLSRLKSHAASFLSCSMWLKLDGSLWICIWSPLKSNVHIWLYWSLLAKLVKIPITPWFDCNFTYVLSHMLISEESRTPDRSGSGDAVSDTAMDIQEAENGIETSKLTDHTYENINTFNWKKKVTKKIWEICILLLRPPRDPSSKRPSPTCCRGVQIFSFFLWFTKQPFPQNGWKVFTENILPAHNLVVDMFVH